MRIRFGGKAKQPTS